MKGEGGNVACGSSEEGGGGNDAIVVCKLNTTFVETSLMILILQALFNIVLCFDVCTSELRCCNVLLLGVLYVINVNLHLTYWMLVVLVHAGDVFICCNCRFRRLLPCEFVTLDVFWTVVNVDA